MFTQQIFTQKNFHPKKFSHKKIFAQIFFHWICQTFLCRPEISLSSLASLWTATTSKRRVGHPDPIHFVNPKCVRIPCVLAPNNFRVWSVSPKISPFPNFHVPMEKNACVGSILMPLTFHKASSDRHTPSIQGLTKSDDPDLCPPKKRLWGVFLHNN